jgi:hypothetical protein
MSKATALTLWQGTDQQFVFTIKNAAETACVNITGWTLSFMAKVRSSDADVAAVITETATISGTFNSDPAVNTQVATITIEDSDTTGVTPRLYQWELKRTDAGAETIEAYGTLDLRQGVHR